MDFPNRIVELMDEKVPIRTDRVFLANGYLRQVSTDDALNRALASEQLFKTSADLAFDVLFAAVQLLLQKCVAGGLDGLRC